MKIVKIARDFVVAVKPIGIPSQADTSGDTDAMSMLSEILASLGENPELWLVHRLDRTVGGLIVFARTARAAAELSKSLGTESFIKDYLAVAEGDPQGGEYIDLIYKDARISKAFIVEKKRIGVKEARLHATPLSKKDGRSLVKVRLSTGRYHQIRVQFAHRRCPLVGDGKYGSRDKGSRTPALFAYHLGFELGGRVNDYFASPDIGSYPWSMFEDEILREVKHD